MSALGCYVRPAELKYKLFLLVEMFLRKIKTILSTIASGKIRTLYHRIKNKVFYHCAIEHNPLYASSLILLISLFQHQWWESQVFYHNGTGAQPIVCKHLICQILSPGVSDKIQTLKLKITIQVLYQ